MAEHYLDARGLQCPLPVLRARKALKTVEVGDRLTVEATDASAPKDFAAFCEATGNLLRSSEVTEGIYRFVIERTA
ncbi:sulfurtransferase TusA family protein [Azospirillum thermophilum]|uniref:Sulfurtransferase TusA family protein n=1 Tax=Azospirillum thermophilum TaxID=2202148 RepID=A0A2S2CLX3_9PROT|nr:sulfurtransferase TusA family protein [Azospirillum thermophilum]AWK85429.1 sulfurtransferase TusA family protein [Azospirillum thermophilum]